MTRDRSDEGKAMNCNDVERTIVELGDDLPAAVRDHLGGCPACRQFAGLHRVLLEGVPEAAPAAALDTRVMASAHRRLARRWRVLSGWRAVSLAAAAGLVLAGAMWFRLAGPTPSPTGTGTMVAAPLAAPLHSWAVAQVDLAVIEDGLDAALAELGGVGMQGQASGNSAEAPDRWDALMELEFDVYFESQNLRQTGG